MEYIAYKNSHILVFENGDIINSRTNKPFTKTDNKGYQRVHPRLKGKHNFFVHRLVAECFIDNPNNFPFVLHLDNNPLNNHKNNLKWGTQSHNIKQAYDQKRICAKGENNGQSKLTKVDVLIMRECKSIGFTVKDISSYFKMNSSYIGQICSSKRWNHI